MGVEIGRVHKIQIDPNNPEVVLITIQVPKGIPIRKGMWATLKKIGITGLSYIEISGGSKNAPLLKTAEGEIPTIPYKPSMFARLGLSVEDLSYQISNISKKVGEVLSEKNVKNFSDIMENLKVSTSVIRQQFFTPENAKNVEMLLKNLKRASARLDSVLVHVDAFVAANKNLPPKFELLMDRLDKAAKNAMEISTLIHKGVQRGDYNLRAITQGTLDTVNQLVDQMQDVVIRVNNILDVIENSPSDFLFKSSRPAPGPGEGVSQR